MYSCEPPGVNIAHPTSGPWRLYSENSPATMNLSTCGNVKGGAMAIGFNAPSGYGEMPSFSHAGWELPATAMNPGVAIVRVKSWVSTDLVSAPQQCDICYQVVHPHNLGPMHVADRVSTDLPAGHTSPTNDPAAPLHRLGLACANGGAGFNCRLLPNRPNLVIHGTETDLVENVAPAGSITGGALASSGVKAGAASLSYTASDGQSGVERVDVVIEGVVVGDHDFSRNLALPVAQQTGDCTYTGLGACASVRSGDIAADTTKVPDGERAVTLRITDAAGNRKEVSGPQIIVANGGAPGAPNGSGATRLALLTARFASTSARSRRLRYSSRPMVRGKLVNERGQAIGGATVAVLERRRAAGARDEQTDAVKTAADGTFTYRLRTGPSRRITFAYQAFSGDPKPAALSGLRTSVRALVSATVSPRSARAGGSIRLKESSISVQCGPLGLA